MDTQYCYKHPKNETGLRCNRCERPICSRCAIHTETGYRCRDCIRGQQKIFDTARWYDFVSALCAAAILSLLASLLSRLIGFFTIFLAPAAGIAIAEIVRALIHRRRNRTLFRLIGMAVLIAGLIPLVPFIAALLSTISGEASLWSVASGSFFTLIWPIVYSILAASSCYYRLAHLQLR